MYILQCTVNFALVSLLALPDRTLIIILVNLGHPPPPAMLTFPPLNFFIELCKAMARSSLNSFQISRSSRCCYCYYCCCCCCCLWRCIHFQIWTVWLTANWFSFSLIFPSFLPFLFFDTLCLSLSLFLPHFIPFAHWKWSNGYTNFM